MSRGRVRLAVLGDPLAYTLSPELHRAGLAALGLEGDSQALRVPSAELASCLDGLEREGYQGVNLTRPHKAAALELVHRSSEAARRAGSLNTVGFAPDRWGETTDGSGFLDLLASVSLAPAAQRVVLLGAGGASRSLALALLEAGAPEICVSCRRASTGCELQAWDYRRVHAVGWRSPEERRSLQRCSLVVNATPLGSTEGDGPPVRLEHVSPHAVVMDLVYGPRPTPWVEAARAAGRTAHDGLGLLVFQARRSLELWLGQPVPVEPLARAVGWPR